MLSQCKIPERAKQLKEKKSKKWDKINQVKALEVGSIKFRDFHRNNFRISR